LTFICLVEYAQVNVHLRNEKNYKKKIEESKKETEKMKMMNENEDPDDWIYLLIGAFPPKPEETEEIEKLEEIKMPNAELLDVKFRYFIPAVFAIFNLMYWSIYMIG